MSTLSSRFLLVRIVHVTYVPTVHQLNMSIESALLSVENGLGWQGGLFTHPTHRVSMALEREVEGESR